MELQINGEARLVPGAVTLLDVINHFKLNEKLVVVEHNLNIITRDKLGETPVTSGDKIEIVHFVGGG